MKKNDFYLIGGIILVVALLFVPMQIFKKVGSKVVVTIDGVEHKTFDINENITYEMLHDDGEWNTLEIKDGYVSMSGASCPDKLCVKHKRIHYDNESITCLPNRVVLRISGGEESDLDAIAE
jgi:hypothetical protein